MTALEQVSELLGGRKVLGTKLHSRLDLIPLVRKGLPYEALQAVTAKLNVSIDVASAALQLARRTLARRKDSNRLDVQESERIVRLAEIAAHAVFALGSLDKATQWLTTGNRALFERRGARSIQTHGLMVEVALDHDIPPARDQSRAPGASSGIVGQVAIIDAKR